MNLLSATWLNQATTGYGSMIIGPTLLALAVNAISWNAGLPLIVAGIVGLLWPEKTAPLGLPKTADACSSKPRPSADRMDAMEVSPPMSPSRGNPRLELVVSRAARDIGL